MLKENDIRQMADACGIAMVGLTTPEPFTQWLNVLKTRQETGRMTDFERTKPEKRIRYDGCLDNVKAVIVIGLPYASKAAWPEERQKRCSLASVAWGEDYHNLVMAKLNQLADCLKSCCPGIKTRGYVDNSRLLDRAAAHRAGLGFFGKNNTLIHPEYGSRFFIGQLLIDRAVEFEAAEPMTSRCGGCKKCLEACPGDALEEGFTLKPEQCISYITQKKTLTPEEEALLTESIYGCDICQNVCPWNRGREIEYTGEIEKVFPKLDDMIRMTDEDFEQIFAKTAAGWRGKKILKRNAEIIKKNRKKHVNSSKKCYNE